MAPSPLIAQEIGGKEGDQIEAEVGGKKSNRVTVVAPGRGPVRVEIVSPDPPPDGTYGDWSVPKVFVDTLNEIAKDVLGSESLDPERQVTAADFEGIEEVPANGLFRVRVTYAKAPEQENVPVKMLRGPPTVEQPFPFFAERSDDPRVYVTPVVYLGAPLRELLAMRAEVGDEITADVEGVRDSVTVVTLPRNGYIPDRGFLSQITNPKRKPSAFERDNQQRVPARWEHDCSCKSVRLIQIIAEPGEGRLVAYRPGDETNAPENGTAVIPWRKAAVISFYFTFPQSAAFIVRDGRPHDCSVIVDLVYPHPRLTKGDVRRQYRLYSMQGVGGLGTAARNIIGQSTLDDPKQKGPGRVSWAVKGSDCGDGVPFLLE